MVECLLRFVFCVGLVRFDSLLTDRIKYDRIVQLLSRTLGIGPSPQGYLAYTSSSKQVA